MIKRGSAGQRAHLAILGNNARRAMTQIPKSTNRFTFGAPEPTRG